jgi:hypothetical protein
MQAREMLHKELPHLIEFSALRRDGSIHVSGTIPLIPDIESLMHVLREST